MQLIEEPFAPFYTITLNFILALLNLRDDWDYLILVTKKVNKKYCLIPGKIT
jgi:hypothetical protein